MVIFCRCANRHRVPYFPSQPWRTTINLMSLAHSLSRDLRSSVFAAIDALQFPRLFLSSAPRALLYHGVSSDMGEGIFNYRGKFITPQAFRKHLEWLKQNFDIVPLTEMLEERRPRSLALTFDDGYANNYTDAFPILRELGVPATFFVTTDFIENGMPLPVDVVEYALGTSVRRELSLEMGANVTFALTSREARIRADLAIKSYMKTLPADRAKAFVENIARACQRDLRADITTPP